ncbi:YceI family protein [Agrococcus versicolor]|uniref:YceI family protein n=1 Tax=Agrococcus versicolor TaxID=501482 RepID=A0ABN3AND4_9MICO
MTDTTITASQIPGYVAGTYVIDASHSSVSFSVRHVVAKVRGIIEHIEGTIVLAEDPHASTVEATVDPTTINTRNADRDAHLRSGDFFSTDEHPTWTFRSTGARVVDGDYLVDGIIQLRGVEREITLELEVGGFGGDPFGNTRVGATATFTISREEYGISFNQTLETGGLMLGDDVKVEVEISAIKQ